MEKPKEQDQITMYFPYDQNLQNKVSIQGTKVEGKVLGKLLWEPADFSIRFGENVAVVGNNGSGKTTLIRKIIQNTQGITLLQSVKIGYFNQNLNVLNKNKSIIENVMVDSIQNETTVRKMLAHLKIYDQKVYQPVATLSGGEQVKVSLAKLLAGVYNTLIFDEPTNFLDIASVKALEDFIQHFQGTVILITHDQTLLKNIVTDRIISLENQQLEQFEGSYEEWMNHNSESMSSLEKELMKVDYQLTSILGKLSIEPTEELDQQFQKLLQKKKELKSQL